MPNLIILKWNLPYVNLDIYSNDSKYFWQMPHVHPIMDRLGTVDDFV